MTRAAWGALLLVSIVGFGLRLWGLGRESIWYDEAVSVRLSGASLGDLVTGRARDAGNPDGYYALLHLWTSVFGRTIESARAMSAVVGGMAIPLIAIFCRRIGLAPRASILAAALVAVSPPLVYLGQEARVFAIFGVVAIVLALSTAIALEGKPLGYVGIALASALLLHLHYYAFFVVPLPGAIFLVSWRRRLAPVLMRLAPAYAVAVAAFLPWLRPFREQLARGTARSADTWWLHLGLMPVYSLVGRTLAWKENLGALVAIEALIVLGIFVPLTILLVRRRRVPYLPAVFALSVPAIATIVSLVESPMIHSHYVAVTFPFVLVLIAVGYSEAWTAAERWVIPSAVLFGGLTIASLVRDYSVSQKTDWRGVAAFVGDRGPELPVYFYEDIGALPFEYYRTGAHTRIMKSFGADGTAWQGAGVASAMAESRDGFWLVLHSMSGAAREEEPAIEAWLGERGFTVEVEPEFTEVRLLRCRPRRA